jgi:hypothetical protein
MGGHFAGALPAGDNRPKKGDPDAPCPDSAPLLECCAATSNCPFTGVREPQGSPKANNMRRWIHFFRQQIGKWHLMAFCSVGSLDFQTLLEPFPLHLA